MSAVVYDTVDPKDLDMTKIPKPTGYYMLLHLPQVQEKTASGIYIPESRQSDEVAAAPVAKVLRMGPDCFIGNNRDGSPKFPSGAYCEEGDWVIIRSYGGHRIMVDGEEYRIIADDSIMATVTDPSVISRVASA